MPCIISFARSGTVLACLLLLAGCVEGSGASSAGNDGPALGYAATALSPAAPSLRLSAADEPVLAVPVAYAAGAPASLAADLGKIAAAEPASPLLALGANVPLPPPRPLDVSAARALDIALLLSPPHGAAATGAIAGPVPVPAAAPKVQLAALFGEGTRLPLPAQQALDPASVIGHQTDQVVTACFPAALNAVLVDISQHFGGKPVIVTSGFRSAAHNHHAGGAGHSFHTRCLAADIQIDGIAPSTIAHYARSLAAVGGVGRYGHTKSVHVDVGERKFSWFGLHRRRRG